MNPDSNMTGNTFGAAVEWELGCVEDGFKEADHIEVVDYGRPMWSQFRPMPPAYFSYWADDAWGNPDGEKMCYVTNHAHFPGNGPIVSAYYGAGSYADKYRALSPYMAARYCDFVEKRGAQFAPVLSKRLGGVPVRYVQSRRESFDAAVPQTYLTVRIGFKDDGTLVAVQSENVHQTGARGGYGDKTHGHLVLPPNAQGFKQTVSPNVYSTMGYYVTNGACTTADPGQPMYEPVNLAFAKMADVLGLDVSDVIMKNVKVTDPSLSACMDAAREAFDWAGKWHLAGERTLEDGRLHGASSCRYAASQTWGMISYNINLRDVAWTARFTCRTPSAHRHVLARMRPSWSSPRRWARLKTSSSTTRPNYSNWQQRRRRRPRIHLHVGGEGGGCAAEAADPWLRALLRHGRDRRRGGPRGLAHHPQGRPDQADAHFRDGAAGRGVLRQAEGSVPDRRHPHDERGHVRGGRRSRDGPRGNPRLRGGARLRQGHPTSSALGQIENAITMNSGRALREELIWDEATGVLLNGNMYDYKVPTILDQPKIEPVPVETRCGGGAYGSTGVAHAHANPGLVGQAIQNATGGDFIDMVPYTPDKVLAVLRKIAQ